ncbi:MAG: ATP phosphoribosyltransferase [Gammaproteobacteria bacterium]|nr:ATP phosphoribosyltransferase [Gammaproteobacteria bacterium]
MADNTRLKIAVQKKGRLTDNSFEMLKDAGLKFTRDRDHLVAYGENLPVDLMLVRDDDIPELVADGICDAGILGQNVAEEYRGEDENPGFTEARVLDYGRCRLSVAVTQDDSASGLADLAGKRIATTYPNLLARTLKSRGVEAEVVLLKGAVEIAPRLGKADAICDLVSTGNTLRANRLRELEPIFESAACLITTNREIETSKQDLLDRLLRRIDGVLAVNESKYIMLHAPRARLAEITGLLPGAESPTVLPLEGSDDKVAVHAVCRESVFWETLENLKSAGASAVLVLPVEKMLA